MVRLVPRIELNVITGFLGSGKTTLLKRFLTTCEADSTFVIINEYGRESIDDRLAIHMDSEIATIANGCLCCTVLDELRAALLNILTRREQGELPGLKRIVIETSGLADPAPILATVLSDENLNEYIKIGTSVATFDVLNGTDSVARFSEAGRQLVAVDRIVLTKGDLATTEQMRDGASQVAIFNPLADMVDNDLPNLASSLFSVVRERKHQLPLPGSATVRDPQHTHALSSFSITLVDPLDWAAFSVWLTALLNRHGARILRFKSVLVVHGLSGRLVIHGVGHKVYPPEHLDDVENEGVQSRLVFITHDIDEAVIKDSLNRFVQFATNSEQPRRLTFGEHPSARASASYS
jgi:G3E family GTPase